MFYPKYGSKRRTKTNTFDNGERNKSSIIITDLTFCPILFNLNTSKQLSLPLVTRILHMIRSSPVNGFMGCLFWSCSIVTIFVGVKFMLIVVRTMRRLRDVSCKERFQCDADLAGDLDNLHSKSAHIRYIGTSKTQWSLSKLTQKINAILKMPER